MMQEPLKLETLEGGDLLNRVNRALNEAAKILDAAGGHGKVQVGLMITVKAEDASFLCECDAKVTLKAPLIAKAETKSEFRLHDGRFTALPLFEAPPAGGAPRTPMTVE